MVFNVSEEQVLLRETVNSFLKQYVNSETLDNFLRSGEGFDRTIWTLMAEQIGLQGIGTPENFGGAGGTLEDVVIIFEEMGRFLYIGPYLVNLIASLAMQRAKGAPHVTDVIEEVCSGKKIASICLLDNGKYFKTGNSCTAIRRKDGYYLSGVKDYVIDGGNVDLYLVPAHTPEGPSLFIVERESKGVEWYSWESMDPTRQIGCLKFVNAKAGIAGDPGAADVILESVQLVASVGLAAEMIGGAAACLDMLLNWSKERTQFSRPIGSFQAIKHRAANVLMEIETAKVLVYYAAHALDNNHADAALWASMAKQAAADAFILAAGENVQIHGAIGFTWEHHSHLYLKRSRMSSTLFGSSTYHREEIAKYIDV